MIFWVDLNLPGAADEVQCAEPLGTSEGVKCGFNAGKRIGVFPRHSINTSVVDTEPGRAIFLLH